MIPPKSMLSIAVLTDELTKGYNLYLLLDDRDGVMSREVASGEMGRGRK